MAGNSQAQNVTQKLIGTHLVSGDMTAGSEISLRIDQVLLQDALGTLVMLALEAMGVDEIKTEVAVQYVDHNLLQTDFKNADDHLFLLDSCRRYGIFYSRPGNGISHPLHMKRFGKPGKSLLGSDSHTCAAGSLGMLSMGAGSMDVATVLAGMAFHLKMPEIWGVNLIGTLPDWVSAKDVVLEMLRRHTVKGALGRVIEYYGPGLQSLSAMDRHVIANMGAELGATTTVFPSDDRIREFLIDENRADDWFELKPDPGAKYDHYEEINLSNLEPLIAKPPSPDNVVPVREISGLPIYQSYIGSSANPGYRDFAIPAMMVQEHQADPSISFDINPTSRPMLEQLIQNGHIAKLLQAGARLHQTGCNGCNGMGQAPASGRPSLRTTPRNFPGRSGNKEDSVYLCSPETATASAITGQITDPRTLDMPYPRFEKPGKTNTRENLFVAPLTIDERRKIAIVKGPNIKSLPPILPLADHMEVPILLKVGDNISTDHINPAGARVLPFRSNLPRISEFCFEILDDTYPERAMQTREISGHAIVGGWNYGQGSSREHATLAPRYLGLQLMLAKGYARIYSQNLPNAGILPLTFLNEEDYDQLEENDVLIVSDLRASICRTQQLSLEVKNKGHNIQVRHSLSNRQIEVLLEGGLVNWVRANVVVDNTPLSNLN